jgi:hypothetical protein
MIIRLNASGQYYLELDSTEQEAIEWMESNFPGKLAAFISKYLRDRHVNMVYQQNEEILKNISPSEKAIIQERVLNASKLEPTTPNE